MRRLLLIALVLVAAGAAYLASWAMHATPHVRDRVVAALNQRFASQVALQSLDASVFPEPRLSGSGLELRFNGRTDVPPLISIGSFQASAGLTGLVSSPLHLRSISLEHLDVHIPVGGINGSPGAAAAADAVATRQDAASIINTLLIDEIVSNQARIVIASGKPGRLPRIFDVEHMRITGFGKLDGAEFQAGLINPLPKGRIETNGVFGPWVSADPSVTPIRGQYTFKDANLDTIKGIGGILSSVGSYKGVLERLDVEGQTETPDFSLDLAGQKVPLTTRFKAVVDGTNGDTFLNHVESKLGQSTIIASGAIVRTEDVKGRRVSLDVRIDQGRLEDLMRLAVKGTTPLTGRIKLVTKLVLPAGTQDVIDRLRLNGQFDLAQARFTSFDVQKRINVLSRRGQGDEASDGTTGENAVSNLRGKFELKDARLDFSELTFAVPGAVVQIAGTYDLHNEAMDFAGELLVDASLADMTSGVKSVLARLAQPFFRRQGGGSRLPIKISGTRANPMFGLDVRRVFRRGDKVKS